MRTRALCLMCTLLVGTGLVLADVQPEARSDASAAATTAQDAGTAGLQSAVNAHVLIDGVEYAVNGTTGERAVCGNGCPAGSLAGQDAGGNNYPASDATFVNPGIGSGRIVCEIYPCPGDTVTAPIGVVSWRGTYITDEDPANGCEKDHLFEIKFYPDAAGAPDVLNPVATFTNVVPVNATIIGEDTLNFGGTILADEWEFTAVLDTPVAQASGWFSVASLQPDPNCVFYMGPSLEDDLQYFRYWEDNPTGGALFGPVSVHYCFAENKAGACCDDRTAICDENSNEFLCALQGGRFVAAPNTCADFSPVCGEGPGACCYDDGTSAILTYADCVSSKATGPIWLGPGTTTDQCCTVYCDPGVGGFTPENEGPCDDGYDDTFNAGCNSDPPSFQSISCDETICGESGTFQGISGCVGDTNCNGVIGFDDINPFVDALLSATYCDGTGFNADISINGSVGFEDINPFVDLLTQNPVPITCPGPLTPPGGQFHDTDWFLYSAAVPTSFTFTVEAEFDAAIFVIGNCGSGCLDNFTVLSTAAPPCTATSITTRCLPAGDYYFVVTTLEFEGVLCGMDYKAYLSCDTVCDVCSADCDPNAYPDSFVEPELCGEEVNLGCSGDAPYQFTSLAFDPNTLCVNVCGQLWADDGTRDLDYYTFNVPNATELEWNINSELPVLSSPIFMPDILNPATCDDDWWFLIAEFAACTYDPNAPVFQRVASGNWVLFVFPDDGDPIFDGYPCCFGQNDYLLTVCAPEPNCPDLLDCATFPDNQEGEPACSNGYVDTYNSGCDGDNSVVVVPNALCTYNPFWFVCGNVGSYQSPSPWYDSDWYEVTTTGPALWCIGGQTEVPLDYDIYDAALGCAGDPLWSGFFSACEGVPDEDPLPPWVVGDPVPTLIPAGTYWIRIGLPEGFEVPCSNPGGAEYGLSLGCYTCPEAAN